MQHDLKIKGYTVAQFPNAPLLVAILAVILGLFASDGSTLFDLARAVFFLGLGIWAYLELAEGVNRFRRFLGLAGLAYVILSLASQLG
jgi:hypothetical protein